MTRAFLSLAILCLLSFDRPAAFAPPAPIAAPAPVPGDDLTVSYVLTITAKKGNTGIAETYNGGIETFFTRQDQARLRLTTLMRIQSLYAQMDQGRLKRVMIVKESGAHKERTPFSADQWTQYNKKYAAQTFELTNDTTLILRYVCKKAIITLQDGRQLTAWYTPNLQSPAFACLEPAFSSVPGLVLQYEYTWRKKTLRYTATSISHKLIDPDVFNPSGS